MGQVPPKYFFPSAPYGSSDAINTLNAAQPAVQNPQTPLLPPNFTDPGTMVTGSNSATQKPATTNATGRTYSPLGGSLGAPFNPFQRMFG